MGQKGNSIFWVIVIVALVAFGLWSLKTNPMPTGDNSQIFNFITNSPNSTSSPNNTTNPNTPAPDSYAANLAKFKNARIQLNDKCQADPSSLTFKNNSLVMIDNRAGVARKIHITSFFDVPAYGFKIAQLYSPTLPAKLYLDCDSSQNVAAILIQK